ncbi:MAG: hypothetical protein ACFFCS_03495 [Candidatus Hodarchaeota archaeon]
MSEYDDYPANEEEIIREQMGQGLDYEENEEMTVNFWKTKVHGANIGIHQAEQYRASSRKFNRGLDIRGEVIFKPKEKRKDGPIKYVVAFNSDFWDVEESSYLKKHAPSDFYKRISIRLFTELKKGAGGIWAGSLEQSLTDSILNSMTQSKSLPVFLLDIPRYDYLIKLSRGKTLAGHRYCFSMIPDKNWIYPMPDKVRFFSIESKPIAIGLDFKVIERGGVNEDKIVAEVDEKTMDVGGKWVITITDPTLQKNHVFKQVLVLFSCLCKYLDDVNQKIEKLFKLTGEQGNLLDIIKEELSYSKDPRHLK